MKTQGGLDRRQFARRSLQLAALCLLAGCNRLSRSPTVAALLEGAEGLTRRGQQALRPRRSMAREFTEADRSPVFPTNGTTSPEDPEDQTRAAPRVAAWQ